MLPTICIWALLEIYDQFWGLKGLKHAIQDQKIAEKWSDFDEIFCAQ